MPQYKLTAKQAQILSDTDWEEDYERTIKLIRSFGVDLIEWDLPWFMEIFVPQQKAKHDQIERDRKKGKGAGYSKPKELKIGEKYHLAWAHRGCVWILKELIPGGKCKLITPKTKKVLTAKREDLLNLRDK